MKFTIITISIFAGLLFLTPNAFSQTVSYDSVSVAYGQILIYGDTVIVPTTDTIIVIPVDSKYKVKTNDSLKTQAFYDNLNSKAAESKWKKELYGTLIRTQNKPDTNGNYSRIANEEYLPYQGLIIKNIDIYQVDVFGGNVRDTSLRTDNKNSQKLNASHINTLKSVLRKNLIIQPGDEVNADKMADNEQLIRSLSFIKDATFVVTPIDSLYANVTLITRDYFPIGLGGGFSSLNKFEIHVNHKNIVGSGQELKYRMLYNTQYSPVIGNQLEYKVNNVGKTLNTFYLKFRETPVYTNWHGKLGKDILTPSIKYGYGIEADYLKDSVRLQYADTGVTFGYKRNYQSVWLGRNFQLSGLPRKNLVLAAKVKRNFFESRPDFNTDSNQFFQNRYSILGSITFYKKENVKTRYLKGFGRTEDVPVGFLITGSAGYVWSELYYVYYGSLRLGYGHTFDQGAYIGSKIDVGSFYKTQFIEGAILYELLYYTKLIKIQRSKLRIIGNFVYKQGINRYPYEWINLGDEIKGISSGDTRGKSKTAISVEATLFTKKNFYGFQIAPYAFAASGLIRNNNWVAYEGTPYSGLGIGIRIRNDNLVFQTFDLSFAYYPQKPVNQKLTRIIFDDREERVFDNFYVGEPYVINY